MLYLLTLSFFLILGFGAVIWQIVRTEKRNAETTFGESTDNISKFPSHDGQSTQQELPEPTLSNQSTQQETHAPILINKSEQQRKSRN